MYPKHSIERIIAATDLVDLIQETVVLVRDGTEYRGRCPFHDDDVSSLRVTSVRQLYKCFSCGAGGDAFSWTMKSGNITFGAAVQTLARRSGIDLPGGESDDA
jgi:DNA primase